MQVEFDEPEFNNIPFPGYYTVHTFHELGETTIDVVKTLEEVYNLTKMKDYYYHYQKLSRDPYAYFIVCRKFYNQSGRRGIWHV